MQVIKPDEIDTSLVKSYVRMGQRNVQLPKPRSSKKIYHAWLYAYRPKNTPRLANMKGHQLDFHRNEMSVIRGRSEKNDNRVVKCHTTKIATHS